MKKMKNMKMEKKNMKKKMMNKINIKYKENEDVKI